MKLNTLATTLIALVKQFNGELSGYVISKTLDSNLNRWSHQQVYRELNKLVLVGYLTNEVLVNVGKPDAKLYSVTEVGAGLDLNPLVLDVDLACLLNVPTYLEYRISTLEAKIDPSMDCCIDVMTSPIETYHYKVELAELLVLKETVLPKLLKCTRPNWTIPTSLLATTN